jgi:hypothetical protein
MLIVVDDSFSTIEMFKGERSFCMVGITHHQNLLASAGSTLALHLYQQC